MPWRIEFDGEVYREDDLTVGQCEQIETLLDGKDWLMIHPLGSAHEASAVLAVCVAARTGDNVEEVRSKLRSMKAGEYIAKVKVVATDDDLPVEYSDGNPPSAGEPSTGS